MAGVSIKLTGFELDADGKIAYRVARDHIRGEDVAVMRAPAPEQEAITKHRTPSAKQLEEWMVLSTRIARSLSYRLEWVTHVDLEDLAQEAFADAMSNYAAGTWDYLEKVAGTLDEWEPLQDQQRAARRGEAEPLDGQQAERFEILDKAVRTWILSLRRELGHWLESQQPPRIKPSDLRKQAKASEEQYLGYNLDETPHRARRHTQRERPPKFGPVTYRQQEGRETPHAE